MRGEQYLMTHNSNDSSTREVSVGFLVQNLAQKFDARMKLKLGKIDVDIKLFPGLMMLKGEDGINQRSFGEKLDFPQYFSSRNIDALVKAGFVERRPDPNSRRATLIFLTTNGKAKAKLLPAIVKQVNDEALADLEPSQRAELVSLLRIANATV